MTESTLDRREEDQNLETYCLIWLDDCMNNSEENLQAQQALRTAINYLIIYQDHHLCLQFIQSLAKDDRAILIVSDAFGPIIIPQVALLQQIISIYLYSPERKIEEDWRQRFPQITAVVDRLDELIQQIQCDQSQRRIHKLDEAVSIRICHSNAQDEGQSSTELNGQFIHSQLLLDCLVRMEATVNEQDELITLCQQLYQNNPSELKIIKEFKENYSSTKSIWWYTRQSFLYRLLNKSLRIQNIELLYLFRFFIRDLAQELKINQCPVPIRVYRGQLMSKDEVEILKNSTNEFISINSFLSTSLNRNLAKFYLTDTKNCDKLERVFFEIDADPRLDNIKPFSNIISLSYFPSEDEVLFMVGSIFRIIHVTFHPEGIWNIQMVLCSENDHQLQVLFRHMRDEFSADKVDLLQFGHVLRTMGKLNDAEKYLHYYFNQLGVDHPEIYSCYHALGMVTELKGDYDSSLTWYTKSLEILIKLMGPNHPDVGVAYNSIASIYDSKGEYTRALESYEKALAIWKQAYGEEHRRIATCLNNMGVAYQEVKQYAMALEFYQKAFIIWKKELPADHYFIGMAHNNIGEIHQCLGCYDLAMEEYNLSLKIKSKSLPPQHSDIAMTFENMGRVHEHQCDYRQALSYFEKAAKIYQHSLPSNHPHMIKIEQSLTRVTSKK